MAMSAALFKALVLVVAFVGVAVLARPSKDSSAHSESSTTAEVPVVTSESFLRELFEELDANKDGVVSKAEIANLVEKLAGEKPFNEQEVMESMQEFLGFQDFSKQIRELAYPAFDPIKNDRAAPKQRSLSPAEVRALEVFSSRIQPSVRRSNQAVRRHPQSSSAPGPDLQRLQDHRRPGPH